MDFKDWFAQAPGIVGVIVVVVVFIKYLKSRDELAKARDESFQETFVAITDSFTERSKQCQEAMNTNTKALAGLESVVARCVGRGVVLLPLLFSIGCAGYREFITSLEGQAALGDVFKAGVVSAGQAAAGNTIAAAFGGGGGVLSLYLAYLAWRRITKKAEAN